MEPIVILFGSVFLVIGISSLFPGFIKSYIKFGNTLEGDKTKITKGTIIWQQIGGVIAIIIGIGVIIAGFGASF